MQPVIHTYRTVPYIVGVVSSTSAHKHDCIYAALAEACRFARGRRGSIEVDYNGKTVWVWKAGKN